MTSKRVAFTFDQMSLTTLERMTEEGGYSSMAECVRESLQITRILQAEARKGFTEVVMRNPETGRERIVVVPRLKALASWAEAGIK